MCQGKGGIRGFGRERGHGEVDKGQVEGSTAEVGANVGHFFSNAIEQDQDNTIVNG